MLGTLKRAGQVLDLFTAEEPEWGVTAAARRLGVGKSLAYDVLASLTEIGLLQRVGHGRYRLGWRTLSLATVLLRTSELKALARPVVCDLAERGGVAVSLLAWDRARIICIDRRHNLRHAPACGPLAGTSLPLDGSAGAKVLLASRSSDEVKSLWGSGFVRTRHATFDELEVDLERVRLHGWARDDADQTLGSRAVAAPVRGPEGVVAAAISIDGSDRFSSTRSDLHARTVVAAASRISAAMRHRELANSSSRIA
jgi:IclR family KDG regulon transcriptional repressor